MRLLNIYTLEFEVSEGKAIPPYAIASHRWCDDEATYLDVLERKNIESQGYQKVERFCEFTRWRDQQRTQHGHTIPLRWLWIDTCCIDQRNSLEVSENINSMYKYYEQAEECYAFLADVPAMDGTMNLYEFAASSWFTRGWTLQEMLASSTIFFLSNDWCVYGHKSSIKSSQLDPTMLSDRSSGGAWSSVACNAWISQFTGIDLDILDKRRDPKSASPEEICSWIKHRETRKEEDLAYCLLGLLGVFMTHIPGEGENAWLRLEEEVCKKRKRQHAQAQHYQLLPWPTQLLSDAESPSSMQLSTLPRIRNLEPNAAQSKPTAFIASTEHQDKLQNAIDDLRNQLGTRTALVEHEKSAISSNETSSSTTITTHHQSRISRSALFSKMLHSAVTLGASGLIATSPTTLSTLLTLIPNSTLLDSTLTKQPQSSVKGHSHVVEEIKKAYHAWKLFRLSKNL